MPIIKGGVSILLLTLCTLFWGAPLILLTLLKVIAPGRRQKEWLLKGLCAVALNWIGVNLWWMRRWLKPDVSIDVPDTLSPEQWWLVISNHRSWTDIFILFMALHRRIPMPRFFPQASAHLDSHRRPRFFGRSSFLSCAASAVNKLR